MPHQCESRYRPAPMLTAPHCDAHHSVMPCNRCVMWQHTGAVWLSARYLYHCDACACALGQVCCMCSVRGPTCHTACTVAHTQGMCACEFAVWTGFVVCDCFPWKLYRSGGFGVWWAKSTHRSDIVSREPVSTHAMPMRQHNTRTDTLFLRYPNPTTMCLNWGHTGSVCVCVRVHVGVSANPQTNLYIFAAVPRAPKELAASGMRSTSGAPTGSSLPSRSPHWHLPSASLLRKHSSNSASSSCFSSSSLVFFAARSSRTASRAKLYF